MWEKVSSVTEGKKKTARHRESSQKGEKEKKVAHERVRAEEK